MTKRHEGDEPVETLAYARPVFPPPGVVWDGVALAAAIVVLATGIVFIVLTLSVMLLG